jgi:hypothetical protein
MKNFKTFLIAIFALTSIISCTKDENKPNKPLEKETISAKWIVGGTSVYESFEFNKSGNYIVVKNVTTKSESSQIVLFGTYVIVDKTTITLSNFGTLKISTITDNSIGFTVQLTGNPTSAIVITATKQNEMAATTRTDLLCRTWEMVTYNGESVTGTDMELTVLFSKAGTYFVSFADPSDENDGGLAQWKWKNVAETEMLYSWDEIPVWSEANSVQIPELTATTLKIIEHEDTYVLQPASITKSVALKTSKSLSNKIIKTRLFKR